MNKKRRINHPPTHLRERAEGKLRKGPESPHVHIKDGKKLIHELKVHQLELELQNEELQGALRELDESRGEYFELYDLAPVAYFTLDSYNMIEKVNLTGADLLKLNRNDVLRKRFASFVKSDCQNAFYEHLDRLRRDKTRQCCELLLVVKGGAELWARLDSIAVPDREGKGEKIRTTITDLTQSKLNEALQQSIKEKEALLREVHHRVKNNMQIISSLLNLQANRVQSPDLKAAFQESQNRVRAMAMIHETLYRSKTLSEINLRSYIQKLAHNLLYTYTTSPARVTMNVNAKDVILDIDQVIPCGLVVNELIANSLKHAFPDGRKGEISLDIHTDVKGDVVLVYSDDGVGLPEGLDIEKTKSLGLSLVVNLMTKQLGAEMELSRDNGLHYTFTFSPKSGNKNR
jgi:two-component sensor histidine kinase/PAS domain-containing protein